MIRVEGLRKRYGTHDALRGVTLEFRTGAVTALVGPNASGKTTLIKSLLGLVRPDAGTVFVKDAPVDEAGRYRRAIGYMPQLARFPENLTVADVIALVASVRAGEGAESPRDDELIEAFHLVREMDRLVRTLSGGTRQKVSAAIAFLFSPEILILDEPTAGLDPLAAAILKDKIRSVRASGRTVLITSHVSAELEGLADDVAFLCDGEIGFTGTFDSLLHQVGEHRFEGAIASLFRSKGRVA
ncbi:MAG: ABC transporter ATP-binding protein [Gemmatimonadota bacterium]|nr:ABC transporter ATP-binding protein [Gemmatimonadota bacterium]